jgi:hypothetical protein
VTSGWPTDHEWNWWFEGSQGGLDGSSMLGVADVGDALAGVPEAGCGWRTSDFRRACGGGASDAVRSWS